MKDRLGDDDLMPFGKYKGQKLGNLPISYMRWMWENAQDEQQKRTPLWQYFAKALGYVDEIVSSDKIVQPEPPRHEARPRYKDPLDEKDNEEQRFEPNEPNPFNE